MVFALLYGHLVIAGDSRDITDSLQSQRRGAVAAVLATIKKIGTGKISSAFAFGGWYDSPIKRTIVAELNNRGLHGSKLYPVAVYRDYVTPKNVNTLETFGGTANRGLTPKESDASEYARRKRDMDKDRLEFTPILIASRLSVCLDKNVSMLN